MSCTTITCSCSHMKDEPEVDHVRVLAWLLAASGGCWLLVWLLSSSPRSGFEWLLPLAGGFYVALGSLFVSRTSVTTRLPARLAILWAAAVGVLLLLTIPQGGSFGSLLMFAFVWATVAFLGWSVPPLVIWSFLRDGGIHRRT